MFKLIITQALWIYKASPPLKNLQHFTSVDEWRPIVSLQVLDQVPWHFACPVSSEELENRCGSHTVMRAAPQVDLSHQSHGTQDDVSLISKWCDFEWKKTRNTQQWTKTPPPTLTCIHSLPWPTALDHEGREKSPGIEVISLSLSPASLAFYAHLVSWPLAGGAPL